jgi:hypothetical protein
MKGIMGTSDGKWDAFETSSGGMSQTEDEAPNQDSGHEKL